MESDEAIRLTIENAIMKLRALQDVPRKKSRFVFWGADPKYFKRARKIARAVGIRLVKPPKE